ncbi:ABC transporter substrate-binding protein [Rarobacter incanus]|uniref:Amino acid ABC transporter substrate-binding protein (PAAT family) n=1 Tax=Rarobacter incanus TaxID=153494 RepID=A0A542SPW7_9MICO|nr:ABC transporter substrate-binding protein [Rarobacter incanus]TQK76660.1 amino acid ABC transporter substrate-binding protein (PAAT family) [Rarobacter incanus]
MRKITVLGITAALALTLAGCSSSDTESSSSAPTNLKDEAIAKLVPESIAKTGKLVVGAELTYAPAEFLGEDGKTPTGYDVDLAKAIGQVLGLQAEVQSSAFDAIIPAIGSKYDVGISSFTISPERIEQVNMVSYFQAGSAFAVAAGNPQGASADDVCGLTVAVQTGTAQDKSLTETLAPACEKAGKAAPTPLQFDQQSEATTALLGGKADVMYADSPIVAYAIEQTGGKLEQLGGIFDSAQQGIVVAKDDTALTEAIQKAVQKLIDDGTYTKILTTWHVETGAVTTAELNPAG